MDDRSLADQNDDQLIAALAPIEPAAVVFGQSGGGALGLATVGATQDTSNSNYVTGSQVTVGSQAVSVTSISAYIGGVDAAPHNQFVFAIYTDSSGRPASLVGQSSTGTLVANS